LRQIRSSYRHFDFAARVHRQGFSTSIFSAAGSKPRFSLGCAVPKVLDLACRSSFHGQRPLLGLSLVTSSLSALLLLSFSAQFWFDPSQLPRYVLIIRLGFGLSARVCSSHRRIYLLEQADSRAIFLQPSLSAVHFSDCCCRFPFRSIESSDSRLEFLEFLLYSHSGFFEHAYKVFDEMIEKEKVLS
jgi:pentatricopeptide repeat protein